MYALSLHSHYRSNAQDDSLAQQVEHIPFKDGVLGSNPSWVTKREQTLSFCFLAHFHQLISERVVNRQSALATPNRAERESKFSLSCNEAKEIRTLLDWNFNH